ncbi:hypothetical protein niasHT_003683 [Heterodera trifolii]|uniref:Uncharacterized protein n=1 Tax=Heterodera trifolii TaxID=157864 RepID=A0ABD2M8Z1_9BILA
MPANPPTMEEILQQIVQLLANQTNAAAAPQAVQNTVPSLPDVSIFEPSDDKGRINECLSRFKFALDCAAPNAQDDIKVKCLMNKLSEAAFSEYHKNSNAAERKQKINGFLNACLSEETDGPIDSKFQSAVLGCTLNDQKKIRNKLQEIIQKKQ